MILEYENEELTINPTQVFSVHNLTLKLNQTEEPRFINHIKAIRNLNVPMDSKAPKPSSQTKEVLKGKNLGSKSGLRRKRSSKHTSESTNEASKSQTGQSRKETNSVGTRTKTKSILHPHYEEGAHPQLSSGMSTVIIIELVYSASFICTLSLHQDMMLQQIPQLKRILEYLLLRIPYLKNMTLHVPPTTSYHKISLNVKSVKGLGSLTSVSKGRAGTSKKLKQNCLPTELKELLSKIIGLSGEIKELKKHVRDMEIELFRDLKEIPTKLETFTSTISSLSSQVAELKNIQWELPTEFATMVENASGATSMNVPSAGKATASPIEGEKNTKDADTKDELVDLLGKNVVTQEDGSDEVISNLKFESVKFLQRQLFRSLKDWEVSSLQFMQRYKKLKKALG
ncbi:hypothetical protein Tco_1362599 [Tanacetum coccineum]